MLCQPPLSLILRIVCVETEIATIREEIVSLEETLVQERRLREHKDAYDAMAREIFKYPPRSDLQRYGLKIVGSDVGTKVLTNML